MSARTGLSGKEKPVIVAALVGAVLGALFVRLKSLPARNDVNWPQLVSFLGFVAFSVYWTVAATDAPAKSAESRASRRVHELLLNAGYLLLFLPTLFPSRILFLQARLVPGWAMPLGLAVQAAGFALAVWARRSLGQNWSGRIEIKVDHQLVRSGPYRVLRHPIYTAVLAMVVGIALVVGKVHALLGVAVVVFAYFRKIRLEETNLDQAFGAEYDDYRRKSWALIPGLY